MIFDGADLPGMLASASSGADFLRRFAGPDGAWYLSAITWLPMLGAFVILGVQALARGDEAEKLAGPARWGALWFSLVTFALTVVMALQFNPLDPDYQFEEELRWFSGFGGGEGLTYRMGVDGVSLPFLLLNTFLFPLCIIASWTAIKHRVVEYMAAFLVLESLINGVFCALDLVLFYLFFEGGLIPMFLIIGVWGGKRRVYASLKFFLYTLLGSLFMLAAMAVMAHEAGTTSIAELARYDFAPSLQTWLWLAFFASFAVKMPMWPVHTWLPDAHVEAPTAGSMILAGILLKLGGYGFLRFSLPMFPDASEAFAPLVYTLSCIAIVYTSLVAFRQTDIKKLIAYSSVAHMGFVTIGIFAATEQGVQGAVFQMVSHGLISAALFLCVGVIYDRAHTREIAFFGGLVHRMPVYAAIFLFFTMGNVGLPGTSGFVGEILALTGAFQANSWVALFTAFGMVLSALYALTLYRRVMYGQSSGPKLDATPMPDVTMREAGVLGVLAAGTLILGVQPSLLTDYTRETVQAQLIAYEAKLADGGPGPALAAKSPSLEEGAAP